MAGEAASKEQSARCRPFSQANGSQCIAAADELHVFAQINDFTVGHDEHTCSAWSDITATPSDAITYDSRPRLNWFLMVLIDLASNESDQQQNH